MRGVMALAALAAVLLTIVGCGSSGSSKQQGATNGTDGGVIKIGASSSKTGALSASGEFAIEGYQTAIDVLNRGGGVLGRQLQLTTYDDQSDAGTAVRLYTKLLTQDHVDFLLGPYSTAITQAVAPVAEKFRVPMVDPQQPNAPNLKYNVGGSAALAKNLEAVPKIAKAHGYDRIALLIQDAPATSEICDEVQKQAHQLGLKVVFSRSYPPDTTDFSSLVLAAKKADPEVVVGCTLVPDSIAITKELSKQGVMPKLLAESVGPADPSFAKSVGELAKGILGSTAWAPTLGTIGNEQFVAAFKKRFGKAPDYHAAEAYAALQVLAAAIKHAHSLDEAKVNTALHNMSVDTVLGTYKVSPSGKQTGYSWYLLQWIKGAQELVYPPTAAEASPQLPSR